MPNGKLHESLLVTEADPLHISLGMTLLKFPAALKKIFSR